MKSGTLTINEKADHVIQTNETLGRAEVAGSEAVSSSTDTPAIERHATNDDEEILDWHQRHLYRTGEAALARLMDKLAQEELNDQNNATTQK